MFANNKYPIFPAVVLLDQELQRLYKRADYTEVGLRFEDIMRDDIDGWENWLMDVYHSASNTSKKREWAAKGAAKGNVHCMFQMGCALCDEGKYEQAESLIKPAAEAGLPEAQMILGNICIGREDLVQAKEWLLKAALQDFASAQKVLGQLYWKENDIAEAKKWLASASKQGNSDATFYLAQIFHKAGDIEGAKYLYLGLAKRGVVGACFNLAELYLAEGNAEEAVRWMEHGKSCAANGPKPIQSMPKKLSLSNG